MTEAEVASNFAAALEKVRQGLEVVVENDHQAIAVLKPAEPPRRKISECIAMLPADSTATIDPDFAADVEEIVKNRKAWNPPAWESFSIPGSSSLPSAEVTVSGKSPNRCRPVREKPRSACRW